MIFIIQSSKHAVTEMTAQTKKAMLTLPLDLQNQIFKFARLHCGCKYASGRIKKHNISTFRTKIRSPKNGSILGKVSGVKHIALEKKKATKSLSTHSV